MANNIRAVSPSLFFSLPGIPLFLFLSGLLAKLATIFLPESLLRLSFLFLCLFPSASASFRERAVRCRASRVQIPKLVHGRRSGYRRDTSKNVIHQALLASSYSHEVVCAARKLRFCAQEIGVRTAVAAFVRRCRQKGRNTRPSEYAPCTL